MPRDSEIEALAPILENPANADKTVEDIAVELIEALDDARAAEQRLAVVLQYSLDGGQTLHHAVLGPFPHDTPEDIAERAWGIVGRPTQPGQGRFMLVPAYANTRTAWDAITPTREARRTALLLAHIRRASGWNPWAPHGPVCRCGVGPGGPKDNGRCPVHPTPERK